MRILRVHNRYQQRGGEDAVFEAESALLAEHGQQVAQLQFTNDDIGERRTATDAVRLAITTIWSAGARTRIREKVNAFKPDVVHFDNTFPLVSPAAYDAVRHEGTAVVQTLHNYRLLCPSATFYRDGHVCEDCLHKTPPLPGVIHGCYRDSKAQTAVAAAMLTTHRLRRTWSRDVDRYIALTGFARDKFIEGGLPADRIVVKPNFAAIDRPAPDPGSNTLLFVGRMTEEKGIRTLLSAVQRLPGDVRLAMMGDGPLGDLVRTSGEGDSRIDALGRRESVEVAANMQRALALIFPSEWYEGFPMTIVEAFGNGLPIIASRLGSMAEIVEDGVTGLLFEPADADDLAAKIRWAADHPSEMRQMGESARRTYEATYTPQRNYAMLMDIYEQAIEASRQQGQRRTS
jgi:glycosyltransferase involved in cell wall biosynthesis